MHAILFRWKRERYKGLSQSSSERQAVMHMKVDACIWTKNSSKFLPITLTAFDMTVPKDVLGRKIMVDDHSEDKTVEIGEKYGWRTYTNPGIGIASAANEALSYITTPFFISIEHDVILAKDWFTRLFPRIRDDVNIAVCQGIRIPTDKTLLAIFGRAWKSWSIDNTIYRTAIIRKLGGFPRKCEGTCTDSWLKKAVEDAGFEWVIDSSVVSEHIYSGIRHYWRKEEKTRFCTCEFWQQGRLDGFPRLFRLAVTSPLYGLQIAMRHNRPEAFLAYPYHRFRLMQAWLTSTMWFPSKMGNELYRSLYRD